ncbi:MAG: LacI family transcriptional regulator [Verrucomicrobia bacterium]|nr:LacI family transcriptional regulator [Verrucomicrobiota bacterium]
MSNRVTLADIAAVAETSQTSVSLVLRGADSGRVSPEVAQKIRMVAESMGYRPDPALRALVAHRDSKRAGLAYRKLALVVPNERMSDWRNSPFHQALLGGATRRAKLLGFGFVTCQLAVGDSYATLSKLRTQGVDGLIFVQPDSVEDQLADFSEQFCVIGIGSALSASKMPIVGPHHLANMNLLAAHLEALGCKRIAYLPQSFLQAEVGSLFEMWADHAAVTRDSWLGVVRGVHSWSSLQDWCNKQRPDALVTTNPWGTVAPAGQYEPCPSYSLALYHRHSSIAGIWQEPEVIGSAAVDLLDLALRKNLRGGEVEPQRLLIPGSWLAGGSTGKPVS